MDVVARGDGRDAMWRIVTTQDGNSRLQKKGWHGRKWVIVASARGTTAVVTHRLRRGIMAVWY